MAMLPLRSQATEVEARLLCEVDGVRPGKPFWVAVELTMSDGWHTYYRNPGDAGLATVVEWSLPDGWSADSLQWPLPSTFGDPPEVTYGYDGRVLLLARITPPEQLSGDSVTIGGALSWLACKELCIPGSADIGLRLPIARGEEPQTGAEREIEQALRILPKPPAETMSIIARATDSTIRLMVSNDTTMSSNAFYFYPIREEIIDHSAPQATRTIPGGIEMTLHPSTFATKPIDRLEGVLVLGSRAGRSGIIVDVPIIR